MGHVESGHVVWMRSAIVAVALGVTVAAVAAACWLPQLHRHVAHPNHPLTTSVGSEFVINTDHGLPGGQLDATVPGTARDGGAAALRHSGVTTRRRGGCARHDSRAYRPRRAGRARSAGGAGIRSHRSRPVDPVLPGSSLRGQRQAVVAIRHRR